MSATLPPPAAVDLNASFSARMDVVRRRFVKRAESDGSPIDALTDLFILRGPPEFIRSDNITCCAIWRLRRRS